MSKTKPGRLTLLIQSLTKAEKRHFKLYARRTFADKNLKFLTLFDLLDKHHYPDQEKIEKKLPGVRGSALSNLKANLYEQLLISLRLLQHQEPSLRIQELISFAKVLNSKGLYLQCLEQLKRARAIATEFGDDNALYTIVEMERSVELFFITKSNPNRAKEIVATNVGIRNVLKSRDQWSNLALLLYDYYLKFGHVKNKEQYQKLETWFFQEIKQIDSDEISMQGKVYQYMAFTWYYFITQQFSLCFKNAGLWVNMMRSNTSLIDKHPIVYLKGLHNVLSALFYSNKPRPFGEYHELLRNYILKNEAGFDQNLKITARIYGYMAGLNNLFLKGSFKGNQAYIDEVVQWLIENAIYLDQNRVQVFQYKIACLHFGADEFEKCIHHLNKIIHGADNEKYLKQDVQCFARILSLIALYDAGEYETVDYQLKSTYRFLIKYGDLQQVQKLIISFIRRSVNMNRADLTPHFEQLRSQLEFIFDDPLERRPLLYLDLISWLSSKIEGISVEEAVRRRQAKAKNPMKGNP